MTEFLAILATGVGTLALRASFVIALAKRHISDDLRAILELIGPSVMGALTVALLLDESGRMSLNIAEGSGLLIGGVVAYKTRNLVLMTLAGMAVYWILAAFL
jgi:branched-subunit amino acid transport protein